MNTNLSFKTIGPFVLAAALLVSGCAKMYYNAGNRYYNNMAYDLAAKKYVKALDMKDIPDAKRKLADAYLKMRNTADAEKWYTEVVNMPDATAQERFNAARVMMANGHYSEAKVQLKQYLDQMPSDQAAQKLYASLDSVAAWKADSAGVVIETPNLNSESSLSPNYYKDGLLFTSDRGGSKKVAEWSGRPFQDIYFAKETSPGSFDRAVKLGKTINMRYHDGTPAVSADGNTLYFTRTNMKKSNAKRSDDDIVMLKLMQATRQDTGWADVTELPFNSDNYSSGHPAISADGNTLYFVSDMPGGQGGTDLYMSKKEGSGWGAPQNLGSVINTPFDEMFPTVNGSDLYFSSEGHYNMGGLDIMRTRYENGAWSTPANVGYPLNTSHDDFGMITKDNITGYLSSNRSSADGKVDQILHFKQEDIFYNLSVLAIMKADGSPLPGVTVELLNKRTGQKESQVTGADGKVAFKLNSETEYTVLGAKQGFFSNSADVTTVGKSASDPIDMTLVLEMEVMKVNEPIVLKNIYYDFNKADIRPDAAKELDRLVKIMNDNPTIVVELASHTDSRGTDTYNEKLSQRRADAAVKYIQSKNIAKTRITAKGYGESKLLNNCKDGVQCTDAQHQENRRTEFTVTGFTDEPIRSNK